MLLFAGISFLLFDHISFRVKLNTKTDSLEVGTVSIKLLIHNILNPFNDSCSELLLF